MCVQCDISSDVPSSDVVILSDVPSNTLHDVPSSAVPSVSYVLSDAASSEVPSESSAMPSAIPGDVQSSEEPSDVPSSDLSSVNDSSSYDPCSEVTVTHAHIHTQHVCVYQVPYQVMSQVASYQF